jgi:hypothetical protein
MHVRNTKIHLHINDYMLFIRLATILTLITHGCNRVVVIIIICARSPFVTPRSIGVDVTTQGSIVVFIQRGPPPRSIGRIEAYLVNHRYHRITIIKGVSYEYREEVQGCIDSPTATKPPSHTYRASCECECQCECGYSYIHIVI